MHRYTVQKCRQTQEMRLRRFSLLYGSIYGYVLYICRKKLHPSELLPQTAVFGKGQRIVLEGPSGSGKTFLCDWLAYVWATQSHYFRNRYQHVLYLNVFNLNGNFETAIYKNLFPDSFKISISEFWSMIERNAQDVLFIIDGYDQLQSVDLSEILAGTRFRESTVLITRSPQTSLRDGFQPDTKWFNLGFSEGNVRRCFKTAVVLSQYEHDQFEKLYFLAGTKLCLSFSLTQIWTQFRASVNLCKSGANA